MIQFFMQDQSKAIAVGLTSRGATVCGTMETPAIYTQIKAHLIWIEATITNSSASVWHHLGRNVASWMIVVMVLLAQCTITS